MEIDKFRIFLIMYIIGMSILIYVHIDFNTITVGFWGDTEYLNPNYFMFHPHVNDSCDELQHKLNYWHPNGTNPIRMKLIESMFDKECIVDLGGIHN